MAELQNQSWVRVPKGAVVKAARDVKKHRDGETVFCPPGSVIETGKLSPKAQSRLTGGAFPALIPKDGSITDPPKTTVHTGEMKITPTEETEKPKGPSRAARRRK